MKPARFSRAKVVPVTLIVLAATCCSLSVAVATSCTTPVVANGIPNLGNTCYLNAQLQCAFHIPLVRNLVENPPKKQPIIVKDTAANPQEAPVDEKHFGEDDTDSQTIQIKQQKDETEEMKESVAIQALRKLFSDMKSTSSSVAPRIFCQTLGIPITEQQDSQEFWRLLLPALSVPALTDLYKGCFEDYIKAIDGSNREKKRKEQFLDLSLDVSKQSVVEGLKDCFGSPELLSEKEGNGWRPEKGADKVDALKGSLLKVQGLPPILQLHLKRFNYDWQTDRMSKINDRCIFPKELDLSTVCDDIQENEKPAAKYILQSIVIHVGEYGAGHYYAYVRPDVRINDWYRFNDHIVEKVAYEDVIADAYGGRNPGAVKSNKILRSRGPRCLVHRITSAFRRRDCFGYGGKTSNAYIIQYVRECDIATLYS